MRGLFSDNYFFDGSIKNTITEEIIKISILDNALKKKDKYCAPKGFYISKEDGSAILACANEIVLLEDYFKISFTKKIKNLIDKLF